MVQNPPLEIFLRELHAKLIEWRNKVGALMPSPNPNFGRKPGPEKQDKPEKPVEE